MVLFRKKQAFLYLQQHILMHFVLEGKEAIFLFNCLPSGDLEDRSRKKPAE
jgi:hypothetical protein